MFFIRICVIIQESNLRVARLGFRIPDVEEEKVGKGREGLQRRPQHSCSRKATSEI